MDGTIVLYLSLCRHVGEVWRVNHLGGRGKFDTMRCILHKLKV